MWARKSLPISQSRLSPPFPRVGDSDLSARERKKTEFSIGSLTEGPTFKFWRLNLGYLLEGGVFSLTIFSLGNPKTNF